MATQQLPSWMTLSTTVYTNAAGQTITSETTLQLPLTYYGPSIPLGTDGAWTYGGLTSPAPSTTFVPTSSPSAISPSITSATPSATPSSSSPSSSYQSTSTSVTSTSTSSSASATSTTSSTATALSKGALIGIIIGAIALFIILLLLFIWFVRWNSRRRDSRAITPIWTEWHVVTPHPTGDEESRPAGVGSPRDSGEEADSFLRRSNSGTRRHSASGQPISSLPPGAAPPHIIGSTSSDRTRSSGASTDYGNVLPGSGHFGQAYNDDGFPALGSNDMIGRIMPPDELLRIVDEEEPEDIPPPRMYNPSHSSLHDHIASLLPPPPFESITRKPSDPSFLDEKEKSVRSVSYPASDMEDSKVFTARRVRVQELGSRGAQDDDSTNTQPIPGPSSWRTSLSRLRMSWFGSSSSRSASRSRHSSRKESDQDAEAGQSLLGHRLRAGINPLGDRPTSGVSTKSAVSGNTIYHDAVSQIGSPLSLPSRAITPASQRGSAALPTDFVPPVPSGAPPAYDEPYDSMGSRNSNPYPTGIDILDIPAPAPFSSVSTIGGPLPPGLVPLSSRRAWRDSLSVITGSSTGAGITIDVLDAEPPRAGDGWRNLAGGHGGGAGPDPSERRTTFGIPQVVHQGNPLVSEQGSLHSMRSHLSPYSPRSSSGSAPASGRALNLSGSNSSRPSANSAQSRVATTSSGSLNSNRRPGPISPAVSAFGHTDAFYSTSRGATEEYHDLNAGPGSRTSILGPMPSFTARSVTQPTIRSVGDTTVMSDDTDVTRTTITTGSEDMTGAPVPWFREPMRAEI